MHPGSYSARKANLLNPTDEVLERIAPSGRRANEPPKVRYMPEPVRFGRDVVPQGAFCQAQFAESDVMEIGLLFAP
eukprot:6234184-Alexandrium_andersonii.AAC.1